MQISRITRVLQSSPNDVDFWVQVFCCNMTMLGPILTVELLQQSNIWPSSVFHICRTRQTSPQSDFHVLGPLKEAMGGRSFRSDKEVQQVVHEWLHSQPKDFFSRGIHALLKCRNSCMEHNGDYVEKWCYCAPYVFNKLWGKKFLMFLFDSPSYSSSVVTSSPCNCK